MVSLLAAVWCKGNSLDARMAACPWALCRGSSAASGVQHWEYRGHSQVHSLQLQGLKTHTDLVRLKNLQWNSWGALTVQESAHGLQHCCLKPSTSFSLMCAGGFYKTSGFCCGLHWLQDVSESIKPELNLPVSGSFPMVVNYLQWQF